MTSFFGSPASVLHSAMRRSENDTRDAGEGITLSFVIVAFGFAALVGLVYFGTPRLADYLARLIVG